MVYAPPPLDNVRRLADLPPPRRRAARLLLDVLRHRAGVELVVTLEPGVAAVLESRGLGWLAAGRALLDLLWAGVACAAPGVGPAVTVREAWRAAS
jgi:hypothetical protein